METKLSKIILMLTMNIEKALIFYWRGIVTSRFTVSLVTSKMC